MIQEFFDGLKELRLRKITLENLTLMFKTTLEGAFRISETLELTSKDILDNGMITIRNSKTGWKNCKCAKWSYRPTKLIKVNKNCQKCKGLGKYRINQYGWVKDETLSQLRELADNTQEGKKLFPISQRQSLRYIDQVIGSRTHALRHTRLTWLLTTDKFNIQDIKQKARHTNIQTTGRYIENNLD